MFNIKADDDRLVVAGDVEKNIVRIKSIGMPRDHDRIDVNEVQHGGDRDKAGPDNYEAALKGD